MSNHENTIFLGEGETWAVGARPEAAITAATGPEFQEGRGAGWASILASARPQSGEAVGASLLAQGQPLAPGPPRPERCAGSGTSAFPSLKKWPQSFGRVWEAGAVPASISLPRHQGRPQAAYLVWCLLSKSCAFSPQIHFRKKKEKRMTKE